MLVLVGVLGACTAQPPDLPVTATTSPEPSEAVPPDEPSTGTPTLFYVKGTTLRAFDPNSGDDTVLNELPSADVTLSLDGARFAVVSDSDDEPDGFIAPEIAVGSVGTEPQTLGSGRSPLFSPTGDRLAAVTEETVVIYDLSTGESQIVLEGGGWSLIGWSGDDVVAAGPSGVALAGAGAPRFLRQSAAGVWGVSPAGPEFLVITRDGSQLVDLDAGTDVPVATGGRWADGMWSPDGTKVAAVVLERGPVELTILDTATGRTSVVPDSRGAQGGVVWSADSEWFAYVRVDPDDSFDLQAVICSAELECEAAFSWGRGVALLGLAPP